VITATTVRS